jgi:WD40 repeat protein
VSQPADISLSPDGYLLASVGRDKVINFYELRHNVHIKTVPVMDELAAVLLLNEQDSARVLQTKPSFVSNKSKKRESGSSSSSSSSGPQSLVLVTAGARGVLRLFRVEIKVCKILLILLYNTYML